MKPILDYVMQIPSRAFLAICIAAMALIAYAVQRTGFYAFGNDDAAKIITAISWSRSPSLLPDQIWMPLEFYITGSVFYFVGNGYVASLIVNGVASTANLLCMYSLARAGYKSCNC